jgi:hypothetical protein
MIFAYLISCDTLLLTRHWPAVACANAYPAEFRLHIHEHEKRKGQKIYSRREMIQHCKQEAMSINWTVLSCLSRGFLSLQKDIEI